MTKKKDPDLTLREALTLAWKSRKDYKGYDRSKGSAFNSWRAIIRTAKGRSIGFPESWKSFDAFMRDVKGEWHRGAVVIRHDTSKPHSAENSFFSEKGTESLGKLTRLVHEGREQTLLEWAKEAGVNYQGVRQRYFKGKNLTSHEIIFGKTKQIRTERERSYIYKTNRILGAYRLRDKKRGFDNDLTISFLRETISKPCVYCGDTDGVGLDRIDNSKGHTKSNVVPCCYVCNCARMDNFTFSEMKVLGAAIREIKRGRNAND